MIDIREFDDMVEDTCQRIVDSNIGITNTSAGSVVRTIIEAILSEVDIAQYTTYQAYLSKCIDTAEGTDLDDLISILGVVRNQAEKFTGKETFYVTEASDTDIIILGGSIISTKQDHNGEIYEFEVVNDAILKAGQLSVDVDVQSTIGRYIYIPKNNVTVMSDDINDIAYINNNSDFVGGSDAETDDELRDRSTGIIDILGKGTSQAIENAVSEIDGVIDVKVYDMRQGLATIDVSIMTEVMPPSTELLGKINTIISDTKSAGIKYYVVYPSTNLLDVKLDITTTSVNMQDISNIIYKYINELHIGQKLILNQLERIVLNEIDDASVDVSFTQPSANVVIGSDEIIRPNSIEISGVKYYKRSN